MSAVLQTHPGAASDVNSRLTFQKNLQTVTNKIHATSNVDEIMLEVSADICTLFNADRLTIYTVGEDKQTIVSKVKTGLNSFKDLKLPIAEHSIAGYVGLSKRMLNLKDVYDEGELKSHNPNLRFLQEVDKRTGYRTKQMLVAPVAEPGSSELVGVVQLINNRAGMPYGTFKPDRIKPMDLLKNLKRDYVESNQWVPIEEAKEGLVILCLDPERVKSSRIVQNVFAARKLAYRVTTLKEFRETLKAFYGAEAADTGDIGDMLHDLEADEVPVEVGGDDDVSAAADNELVKLVNKIIIDAYNQGASDIHIEPYPGKGKTEIRLRKDGTLVPYIEVPGSYRNALVARIKIMCDLDISEKRKPQDGKIKFKKFGPLDIELRVATIPSQGGVEDIVMRILSAGEPIPLEKLGLSPSQLPKLKDTVSKPYGLFFCCGPTRSGKTRSEEHTSELPSPCNLVCRLLL